MAYCILIQIHLIVNTHSFRKSKVHLQLFAAHATIADLNGYKYSRHDLKSSKGQLQDAAPKVIHFLCSSLSLSAIAQAF